MFRPLFFLFLVSAVVAPIPPERCGRNEEWNACYQPACKENACNRLNVDVHKKKCFTKVACQSGCVCKKGYYRHDWFKLCGTLRQCYLK